MKEPEDDKQAVAGLDNLWTMHKQCEEMLAEIGTVMSNSLSENGNAKRMIDHYTDAIRQLHGEIKGTLVYVG